MNRLSLIAHAGVQAAVPYNRWFFQGLEEKREAGEDGRQAAETLGGFVFIFDTRHDTERQRHGRQIER